MDRLITDARVRSAPRRLTRPLATAGGILHELPGAELRVVTACGCVAIAEAPLLVGGPLAGEALAKELADAVAGWAGCRVGELEAAATAPAVSPPAAWAIDTAIAGVKARGQGLLAARAIARHPDAGRRYTVRTNALATARSPAELEREVAALVAAGEHTIKLKVGGGSLADDEDRVAAARAAAGPTTVLRLDANQAWDVAEAERRLRRLSAYDLDYVEQPVPGSDLPALARVRSRSPVPVAADEAARNAEGAKHVLAAGAADVLVLKPSALGPLAATRELAERAASAGVRTVLSSLFDSGASLWAQVGLAAGLGPGEAHGLATAALLAEPGDAPVPVRGVVTF